MRQGPPFDALVLDRPVAIGVDRHVMSVASKRASEPDDGRFGPAQRTGLEISAVIMFGVVGNYDRRHQSIAILFSGGINDYSKRFVDPRKKFRVRPIGGSVARPGFSARQLCRTLQRVDQFPTGERRGDDNAAVGVSYVRG